MAVNEKFLDKMYEIAFIGLSTVNGALDGIVFATASDEHARIWVGADKKTHYDIDRSEFYRVPENLIERLQAKPSIKEVSIDELGQTIKEHQYKIRNDVLVGLREIFRRLMEIQQL